MRAHSLTSWLLTLSLVAAPTGAIAITAAEYGVILNLSGRQRMLTQKMSKETLLVAAGIDAETNRANLAKTTKLFETTLSGLRDGSSELGLPPTENARIVKQLDKVRGMYVELKPIFSATAGGGSPGEAERATLAAKNVPLLKEMNKAVKMYERASKKVLTGDDALGVVINLAGRQRMLTQKMTKECLLAELGVDTDGNRINMRETSSLFDRTLTGLINGDSDLELPATTDPTIRKQLEIVKSLWADFYPVITKGSDPRKTLTDSEIETLSKGNLPLLKEMNKAVKMFEQATKG